MVAADPLAIRHAELQARVQAWQEAWARRGEGKNAAVVALLSEQVLGETLAQQIEVRLLEARREIDNEIARFAGDLAAGVARACNASDTSAIQRRTQEKFLSIGRVEDGFATKMDELGPLVALYLRVSAALGTTPS